MMNTDTILTSNLCMSLVVVNSDQTQIADYNIPVIDRRDKIVHNARVCRGKSFRLARMIQENSWRSPSEIAKIIMLDKIDEEKYNIE